MKSHRYLHKTVFIFVLVVLTCVQAACGFHLRGVFTLPNSITPVFVDLNGNDNELNRELESSIAAIDENALASSEIEAKTILTITNAQMNQRVAAVDSLGRARNYELSYQFHYELKKAPVSNEHTDIIKANTLELKRDLLFDPESVLAVEHEKNALQKDMRKDAAQIVLRQLSTIKFPEAQTQ
ncbi:MAG: LPS assembly lipoprotein LptE [Gammaproteobacteria bacterium]|nr:LPS assembly lipoprotein LptE [Gammaproteobacteria bacterium]